MVQYAVSKWMKLSNYGCDTVRMLRGKSATHAFLKAEFPNTSKGAWETVWLPQPVLLGTEEDMGLVVQAIHKIQANAAQLAV